MSNHPMTRYIPIGDVELRLDMIARALGIPAATLDKLASGEWVAVPREATEAMILAGHRQIDWCRSDQGTCDPYDPSQFPEGVGSSCGEDVADAYRAMLTAATEAAGHDD